MTEAVIFDCDGVLVDTEPVGNAVLAELVTELGIATTPEQSVETYMGRSMASCLAMLEERLGEPPPADFAERYRVATEAAWRSGLKPVPGVVEALDRLALPSCVASSGEHERIRLTLGLTGLLPRFEGRIFSAAEVPRGKPAPDLFLHAAERMGFDPSTTAVVEDTVPGVEAARVAGMRVLAFARLVPAAALEAAGAEVFDDMGVLPELLARSRSDR